MSAERTLRPDLPVFDALPELPTLVDSELAGGLRVLVVRRPTVPLIEIRLAFPIGRELTSRTAELAVVGEAILGGTTAHDRAGLASAAQALGGEIAVHVGKDRVQVSASCLSAHVGELIALVSEVLSGAAYAEGVVLADRRRVADEIVLARSQPGVLVADVFDRRFFRGHPYAKGLPSPGGVRRVRSDALAGLHRELFTPRGAVLVVVGDIELKGVAGRLEEAFGSWLEVESSERTLPERTVSPRPGPLGLMHREAAVQSNIRIGAIAPGRGDPAWPATALANLVFGGLFGSRLVENLRERRGYSYSPHSSVEHLLAGSRLVTGLEVGTEVTAAALAEVTYELGRIAISGFEDAEIEDARRYAIGSLVLGTATQSGLASSLAGVVLDGASPSYLETYPKALLNCDAAAMNEVARTVFAPSAMTTVVLGDAGVVEGPLAALGAVSLID
jgi:zinc protease